MRRKVKIEVNATSANIGLNRIGQIAVNVSDLKPAIEFYSDVLEMKYLFEVPTMAFFDCGVIRIMLGVAEKPEFDHPSSIIYYAVEDIHKTCDVFKSRGVRFESAPHLVARLPDHQLWMAFFRDLDDNLLAIMCEIKNL